VPDLFDPFAGDCFHEHEGAAVDDRLGGHGDDRRYGQARVVQRRHDPALPDHIGGAGHPNSGGRQAQDPLLTVELDAIGPSRVPFGHRREL
jgi:hypothetical protein